MAIYIKYNKTNSNSEINFHPFEIIYKTYNLLLNILCKKIMTEKLTNFELG